MTKASDGYRFRELVHWDDIYTLVMTNRFLQFSEKKALVEKYNELCRPSYLNSPDLNGRTIAHRLCELCEYQEDMVDTLKYLASQGANLLFSGEYGSLLHVANTTSMVECVIFTKLIFENPYSLLGIY